MPELLLLLLPGEVVRLTTRRHVLTLLVPLVVILAATVLLAAQACPAALALRLDGRCPLVVAVGLAVAALPFVLDWITTRFVLTNYRLIRLQAPLWRRSRELDLSAIQALSMRQSLLGRLFGFGDVWADTAATHGGWIALDFVPDPFRVRDEITAAIAAARAAGAARDAVSTTRQEG